MRVLLSVVFAVLGIVLGIISSDVIIQSGRMIVGDVKIECIDGDYCVGDSAGRILNALFLTDTIGGLGAILCDGNYIFLSDLVGGEVCEGDSYVLVFRNSTARTMIHIDSGTVSEIVRGPLHTLDL